MVEIAKQPKNNYLFKIIMSILFLMVILGLGYGWYLYQNITRQIHEIDYNVKNLQNIDDTQKNSIQYQVENLNSQITDIRNHLSKITENKGGLFLFQISELISVANQSLVAYGDLNNAIDVLSYAENMLSSHPEPEFSGLKFALSRDLEELKKLKPIDNVTYNAKLAVLITSIDSLVLKKTDYNPKEMTSIEQKSPSKLVQFWENAKKDLLLIFKITKISGTNSVTLYPEGEVIVKQNIKLDLLNAKMDLLTHDQKSWLYFLNDANQNINKYFKTKTNAAFVSHGIEELQQLNISVVKYQINNTVNELTKLNQLVNN